VLFIITRTGDVLFVVSTSMALNDLKSQNKGFGDFLRFSAAEK